MSITTLWSFGLFTQRTLESRSALRHVAHFSSCRGVFALFSVIIGAWVLTSTSRADELIPFGATWRYQIGLGEASSPAEAWRKPDFSDSAWVEGAAPVGYGEPDIVTTIPSSAAGGWLSVFFRRTFVLSNPAGVSELDLSVRIDDGFVAWINGVEIGRYNVPDGELGFGGNAITAAEPTTVSIVLTNDLSQLLRTGNNTLAIHAFNANSGSSDLLVDAHLLSTSDTTAPEVIETVPPAGAQVRQLRFVEVTFSESVRGVNASDFLINGFPATNFTQISPRQYQFSFPEPVQGPVQIAWAPGHQITDLANPGNAFAPSAWSYQLDPSAPAAQVIISEFLADNAGGLKDDDGNRSDWIELLNLGTEAVNLQDWALTDEPERPQKWMLPQWTLPPNSYLLIWASEKNRTNVANALHTNFKLSTSGEYLALVDSDRRVVSQFAPIYPSQRPDTSYGRDRVNPELVGYFATPTPGKANTTSGTGFAPDPVFSVPGGVYSSTSIPVTLSAPAGEIRYTTDGTAPIPSSPLYNGPITVRSTTVVQARVFKAGLLPSAIVAQTYTLVGNNAAEFNSNLPILVVNTLSRGIPQDQRVRAFLSAFEPHDGRARLKGQPDYDGAVQIEVRGQTSSGFAKTPYNLETDDLYGNDMEVPLLGLPAESDWVLHNPFSDKCLMNNVLAFEVHRAMGHYAPRCRFVEVFVKTGTGPLSYPDDYAGVYVLMEKIKIDGNRVDIARLTPAHNTEPEISGGYIIKKDKDSPGDLSFSTQGGSQFSGQSLKYHEPKPREITSAQRTWIANYLNQFEKALYATDWLKRTGTNHYSAYVDVDSFVDYHWIVEFTKQIDGYRLSNFMSKDRGKPLQMAPIWDWNLAWGNADYLTGEFTSGWYYAQVGDNEHIWLRRMMVGTPFVSTDGQGKPDFSQGDPDFNQKIIDRWAVLRSSALAASNIVRRIDEIAADLNEAQARDFAKYPRLDSYVWPNPGFYIASTYGEIIEAMKSWVQGRFDWIDRQYLAAPQLGLTAGPIQAGARLGLSAAAGAILYTLDGTDPRLPGGAVNPQARTYAASPIPLDRNTRVFARARQGSGWSGPAVATFVVQTPPLVVTELMYHPAVPPTGDTNPADSFEFVELKNIGTETLGLSGFRFTRGIDYTFSSASAVTSLPPGGYVLLVKNRAAFSARYPGAVNFVAGEYSGSLDNSGERLTLEGPLLEPILDFTYNNAWLPITDGAGFSMIIRNPAGPFESWNSATAWRSSSRLGGSPGAEDPAPGAWPTILVNEVLSRPELPQVDAIELFNPGTANVDLGGWFLSDDLSNPRKYRLPSPTVISAGGFLVIRETAFGADPMNGFGLSSAGDSIYLFSGDGNELTGYAHGFRFGAAAPDVTFGRYIPSTGVEHWVAQQTNTLGAANSGPRVGPIIINEIMFAPTASGSTNNTTDEFVELLNVSSQTVALYDAVIRTNTWRLSGGADFPFPTGASLLPGEFALLVNFNPTNTASLARFRSLYALDPAVPIFGPLAGNLNNSGERLSLSRPDVATSIVVTNPTLHILIDEVHYSATSPWPTGANATGQSLQKINASQYGDDPANWRVGTPTAGKANGAETGDSDADGLPDAWEQQYFGNLNARPEGDPDGDGLTNAQELVAGTSPIDPSSTVALAAEAPSTDTVRLRFSTVAGRSYSILGADALEGPWQVIQTIPTASGTVESFTVDGTARAKFYQLRVNTP